MFLDRGHWKGLAVALGLLAARCDGDEQMLSPDGRSPGPPSVLIEPTFRVGEQSLACSDFAISSLEGTLLTTDRSVVQGYPQRGPCQPVSFAGPAGESVLLLRALGRLGESEEETLFSAEVAVDLPALPLSVDLQPEAALLEIAWSFGERQQEPCNSEVDRVEIAVRSSATDRPVERRFGCAEQPVLIDQPFRAIAQHVEVRAIAAGDFPVYADTDDRVLRRGLNRANAVLKPLGGRLLFDWQFGIGTERVDACDDPRVQVRTIEVAVRNLVLDANGGGFQPDGQAPVVAQLDCASPRPASFGPARFAAGRLLQIDFEADGVHRFLGRERLPMPEGDALLELSTLGAVGTATLSFSASEACVPSRADRFALDIIPEGETMPVATRVLVAAQSLLVFQDLPYGRYRVRARREPALTGCPPVETVRVVGRRVEGWGNLEL